MTWSTYGSFLIFAVVLVLVPGPDFAVITKNTLAGGRRRGSWSAAGVASSNAVQGLAAAAGLGALVTRAQPVFQVIKWAGIGYLAYLGVQALRLTRARRLLARRHVRRALDAATGTALLGFSAKLATE